MADNEFMTGYSIGQNEGRNSGGGGLFGGGDGIWGFLVLALIFGWGGGGFGFGGGYGGGGGSGMQGMVTRADINEGFALNNITDGIRGIQQGICDSTYALNNAITGGFHNQTVATMQGFNGVERGFCSLSHQLSDCCCENRAAIAQVRYDMANQTRDAIEAGNANTRAILDFLTNEKIDTLRSENQILRFQASQSAQNSLISASMDAQTAELIRRLRTPEAVPAYVVPNPNCCYGNPAGIGYNAAGYGGNCGGGCGCGGGFNGFAA